MRGRVRSFVALMIGVVSVSAGAQSVRDRIRLAPGTATAVTEAQASELTLTVTEVAVRPIQTWIRTAGLAHQTRRTLSATVSPPESRLLEIGQRVRAFPPESRSSMYQARVTALRPSGEGTEVIVELSGPGREGSTHYVLEIVADYGDFLSIPNEAIIEDGGRRMVYAQLAEGRYEPREVQTGLQGELYTQVLGGLRAGDHVVTFGSFFVDADHKLKGS